MRMRDIHYTYALTPELDADNHTSVSHFWAISPVYRAPHTVNTHTHRQRGRNLCFAFIMHCILCRALPELCMRKSQLACAASLQASIRGINDFFKGISLSLTQFPVKAAEAKADKAKPSQSQSHPHYALLPA